MLRMYAVVMLCLGVAGWGMRDFAPAAKSAIYAGGGTAVIAFLVSFLQPPRMQQLGKALAIAMTCLTGWRASMAFNQPGKDDVFLMLGSMLTASLTLLILMSRTSRTPAVVKKNL